MSCRPLLCSWRWYTPAIEEGPGAAEPANPLNHPEIKHASASGGHQTPRPAHFFAQPIGDHEFAVGAIFGGEERQDTENLGIGRQREIFLVLDKAVHNFPSTSAEIPDAVAGADQ